LTYLPLLNSVQKSTCDIWWNIVTISINQALESIHPVDKGSSDHFGQATCQKFIHDFI
jgi:hypothetical protein